LTKKQKYDFTIAWDKLPNATKAEFTKKVKQIEIDAIERLANLYNVDFYIIYQNVTPLDPQAEWEWEDNVEKGLPLDVYWEEFEMQFFKEELREKDIL
jgi:hypothetical protein